MSVKGKKDELLSRVFSLKKKAGENKGERMKIFQFCSSSLQPVPRGGDEINFDLIRSITLHRLLLSTAASVY